MLDTNNFCVILFGNFNAPGFNWGCRTSLPSSHHYSKLKGVLYTPPHVFLASGSMSKLLTA
jgi:hypothetical protein